MHSPLSAAPVSGQLMAGRGRVSPPLAFDSPRENRGVVPWDVPPREVPSDATMTHSLLCARLLAQLREIWLGGLQTRRSLGRGPRPGAPRMLQPGRPSCVLKIPGPASSLPLTTPLIQCSWRVGHWGTSGSPRASPNCLIPGFSSFSICLGTYAAAPVMC